ncbi:MAG: hypothetical protein QM651_13660 [Rhodoblastus sp.]
MEWGTVAQWASVVIAGGSLITAGVSLLIAVRSSRSKRHEEALKAMRDEEEKARLALKQELLNAIGNASLDVRSLKSDVGRAFERVDTVESAVARIENEFRHLPDKDSVHKLELQTTRIEGKLDKLFERVEPVRNIAWRLQEDALEQARAKAEETRPRAGATA